MTSLEVRTEDDYNKYIGVTWLLFVLPNLEVFSVLTLYLTMLGTATLPGWRHHCSRQECRCPTVSPSPPAPIGCQGGVGAGHHNNVLGWHDIETFNKVRSTFLGQHSHCIANADGLSPIYSTFISVFSSKTPNWWEGRGGGTGADWGEARLWPRVGLTDQLMSWRLQSAKPPVVWLLWGDWCSWAPALQEEISQSL